MVNVYYPYMLCRLQMLPLACSTKRSSQFQAMIELRVRRYLPSCFVRLGVASLRVHHGLLVNTLQWMVFSFEGGQNAPKHFLGTSILNVNLIFHFLSRKQNAWLLMDVWFICLAVGY